MVIRVQLKYRHPSCSKGNITPTPRELSVLQLSSEGIENQVGGQYSDSSDDDSDDSTSYKKDSDNDFKNFLHQ
ncbi:hypothetical protein RDI58_019983 [Solanum bulbocastanum]|uniref:Uncharacterized protein n=1 Tax=Solanum bulbocastanum TaxID=147425 RepID=A0AAN8Y7G3_SOLBU